MGVRMKNRLLSNVAMGTGLAMALCLVAPFGVVAEETKAFRHGSPEFEAFLEDTDSSADKAAKRVLAATPEMREARLERLSVRLMGASRWERRRILRREGRIMRAMSATNREMIKAERKAFRDKHGFLSIRDRRNLFESGEFDYSEEERRVLRTRFRDLSKRERRVLVRKMKNVRDLPEEERRELHDRLNEMKLLSADQKDEFITKAKRWHGMPEERREKLRAQMKKLREMPVDERIDLLERAMENSKSSEQ
jgi:hypothetical protein